MTLRAVRPLMVPVGERFCRVLGYGFCIVHKNRALATIYEEIIIYIGCNYDQSHFEIYLTPVKTQLLQYNLARDLMLFYHSNKIKA